MIFWPLRPQRHRLLPCRADNNESAYSATQCIQNVAVEGITKRIRIWPHRRFILRIAVKHSVRGRGRGKYEFTFRSKVIHRVYRNKISPPISYVCGGCRLQKSDNAIERHEPSITKDGTETLAALYVPSTAANALSPVAIMRPVFHPLYYDYHAHIYEADKSLGCSIERRRVGWGPIVGALARHVGNEPVVATNWARYIRWDHGCTVQFTESQTDRYHHGGGGGEWGKWIDLIGFVYW